MAKRKSSPSQGALFEFDEPVAVAAPVQAADEPQPASDPESTEFTLVGKTVYVIDANSLIFQVFHAIPEMTSPEGLPVSAVFGFTRDVLFLLESKKPDYLFVAFDTSAPTFRHELYDHYKAGRSEMPQDLVPQFEPIKQIVAALGLASIELDGYEADDLLATVAATTEALGGKCVIVSGDKDCRQLISDQVGIYNVRKNQMLDAAALFVDWGVRPEQVVDFQTLVGDSVDNIPGVPLVGPKVAGEWLAKFGTLENLYAHADELPKGKRKENLLATREQTVLSRQLCELKRDVPFDLPWEAAATGNYNEPALQSLFKRFGFHGFGGRVVALAAQAPKRRVEKPNLAVTYTLVDTPEKLAAFVDELNQQCEVSFDTETTQSHEHAVGKVWPRWSRVVGYSFSFAACAGYYLPVMAPPGEACLDATATLEALRPALENPAIRKIGQNLKYDLIVLRAAGVEVRGVHFDTMMASYLLDAGERIHNLDELALRYLSHQTTKISALIGTGKNQKRMCDVPLATITHYAAEDADVALRLRGPLETRLRQATTPVGSLEDLLHDVEMPLVEVLSDFEFTGITIDVPLLNRLSEKYTDLLAKLEAEIHTLAGETFNVNSVKQLQTILFEKLGLKVIKRTATGPSTDAEVLEELADQGHALPTKLLEYRQFSKLKGTYVDALPTMVHPETNRVHASFRQDVAATGRLSSEDPNLQNIPIRSEAGREIRNAFLPGHTGWKLLAADYSQIELRVLAHYCQDEALLKAFANDEDIHTSVAAQVYGKPLDEVSKLERRNAKAVNFGIIYGQSPFGLAKGLGISKEEAAEFIVKYFAKYSGVERFMREVLDGCLRTGYVYTILGRRRAVSGVRASSPRVMGVPQRNLPERTAVNTVIQGSAADLIKLAMIAVHRRLREEKFQAKMLLQIHDELVFETPPEEEERLGKLVTESMSGVMPLRVPLKVDVKSGPNWGACEAWA